MKRLLRGILIVTICVTAIMALVIAADATELKTGIGIVEASGLRLRASASADSDVIATAPNGDNVVIIRQVGDWYLVNYNLHIGYMHSDYITVKQRENIDLGYGSIDAAVVNMRSGPSSASSLVDQVSQGEKVYIFGFNSNWYKVKYDGQVGYIRSDLVTLLEKPYDNKGSSVGSNSSSGSSGSSSSGSSSSIGQQIATYGQKFVGYPYVWGGTSPSGFDCSGFVQYIYKQFGYSINRTATAQLQNGYSVSYDNLKPGDLVFFGSSSSSASHVGMYIGNGQFVHAANSSSGVKISSLSESYYANRYIGARRIAG